MNRLQQLWQQLDTQTGIFRRIRYDAISSCDLYIGLKMPESQRLMAVRLPKKLASGIKHVPEFQGIRVEKVADTDDSSQFFLNLVLTDSLLVDVFDVLLSDLVSRLLPLSDPVKTVKTFLNQLILWDELFGHYKAGGLSQEQQKGLFGELYLLRKLLDKGLIPSLAVDSWVGSEAAVQDFRSAGWAIEVKTSSQTTHERLTINGERQLDESIVDRLFLYYLNVDVRTGAGELLSDLVEGVRAKLITEVSALLVFNRKLAKAGYFDAQATLYDQSGYVFRAEHRFNVSGDFPRIVAADLRRGVGEVHYSISLLACLPYSITEPELLLTLI